MGKKTFAALAAAAMIICVCRLSGYIKPCFAESGRITIVGKHGVYEYGECKKQSAGFYGAELNVDDIVEEVALKEYVAPKDAYVRFFPNAKNKFVATEGSDGENIDKVKLKDDILTALSVGGGAIKPAYNLVKRRFYKKDLDLDIKKRGEFSTSFESSIPERASNIARAAAKLNGVIVAAGEEFSFNDTVGKRSEENGYKNAKIIVDGEFVEGVGGGVCQVSTTLYNAALLSGLKISEYHPHTLSVSYVENSFDAMVNYGTCDLKFVNDTPSPVYIRTIVDGRTLKVVFYGKKQKYVYERKSVVNEIVKMPVEEIFDPALDENEYVIRSAGKDGVKSDGYLIKKVDGKVVSETLIRSDYYKPVTEVIERGTAKNDL